MKQYYLNSGLNVKDFIYVLIVIWCLELGGSGEYKHVGAGILEIK